LPLDFNPGQRFRSRATLGVGAVSGDLPFGGHGSYTSVIGSPALFCELVGVPKGSSVMRPAWTPDRRFLTRF
jgi:hypothetical protein